MNYLSSKELSKKWGIGQCRIILLARKGRIKDAKKYGKTWVFPENSIKPIDGRTKLGKSESKNESDNFRYPIFEYKNISSFSPPLNDEELILKEFAELFNACKFEEAYLLLKDLPMKSLNRYHRITSLYYCCMIHIFLGNKKEFIEYWEKLNMELTQDFPHKIEMREYLYEIEATIGTNNYYVNEFHIDPTYSYHKSFLPRLCNLASTYLEMGERTISLHELQIFECNCSFLDNTDNYLDSQTLHINLGIAYAFNGKNKERDYHFKKAIDLAQQYDMFYNLATSFYYLQKEFNDVLKEYPRSLKDKLISLGNKLHDKFAHFNEILQLESIYNLLTKNDYIYIVYALQDLTNKEIAERLHVSIGTVGKHYSEIYALLGVKNKNELISLYHALT